MAEYNSKVIHQYADKLYSKAASMLLAYTAVGGIVCGGLGYFASLFLSSMRPDVEVSNMLTIIALVLGAVGGYMIGTERAFSLKLQAQTALCQMRIEENTRAR